MASLTATFSEIESGAKGAVGPRLSPRVVVVGAGIGGLSAAITLATAGAEVTVIEKSSQAGGKIRTLEVAGTLIDAGPTVLTMRWVFERLFEESGSSLDACLNTTKLDILARHAWQDGSRVDLFADRARSTDAIAEFAGTREAKAFERFAKRSERLYRTLSPAFMDAERPGPFGLAARMARQDLASLVLVNPLSSLWADLTSSFSDPRLRQLFGRYATYSGASPFEASATLMLIWHAEEAGVWTVEGGMKALAVALETRARSLGVTFRYNSRASRVVVDNAQVTSVEVNGNERLPADAVIANCDSNALASGLLGPDVRQAIGATPQGERSLSAMATALAGTIEGFPLTRHNVFFSRDYRAEFDDIFTRGQPPVEPTVYLCAQDRECPGTAAQASISNAAGTRPTIGPERALVLVNAPANGDDRDYPERETEACWENTLKVLNNCGLAFSTAPQRVTATPRTFAELFPATGGAIYGRSSHGWAAAFRRPGCRTAIPGLYLAGGSVHPGAGVPMAALSGRRAAASLLEDLALTRRFLPVATSGGTWTP